MNFKSDNYWGVHPSILDAIVAANTGSAGSYGHDTYSEQLQSRMSQIFEKDVSVFLVGTGTVCNSLALAAICPSYGMILCSREAHINTDECNAPSLFTGGSKIAAASSIPSKIDIDFVRTRIAKANGFVPHENPPHAISITQSTELGLVYTLEEMKAIGDLAKQGGLRVHLDGARFANALVALQCTPAEMTWKVGVDILSFGVTKNGGLMGEVVVIFDPVIAKNFEYLHKRAGQLLSKTRFFAAQVLAYLKDDLWLTMARTANEMAKKLADGIKEIPNLKLALPVEANELFVEMPSSLAKALWEQGFEFYEWNDGQYRFVTSWATTEEMVDKFLTAMKESQ
jgi:threonine aldolase